MSDVHTTQKHRITVELTDADLEALRDWQQHTGTSSLQWALINAIYFCDSHNPKSRVAGQQAT